MRKEFLSFSPPSISEEEIKEVVNTLHSDWITTGPKTKKFEADFTSFIGAKSSLALNSCTAGLHTALITLGIGFGDEVITTPMTFAASVNVIEHVGAIPVLVDVEPDTLNIDASKIESAITSKTKAILVVHFAGHPVDLDPIKEIAKRYCLYVVEDAAHALPAKYKGRFIGSENNLTAFSFYATKNITTSEGGMLTGDLKLLEKAKVISLHGMSRDAWKRYDKNGSWFYEVVSPGFKYNMTDIQASIGLVQLKKLNNFQVRRKEIVKMYNQAFSLLDSLEIPTEHSNVESAWHLYVLRLNLDTLNIDRNRFIEEMKIRNIGTSVHFIPIHLHPYYRDKYKWKPEDFPVAYFNYQKMLSIPLHPRLTDNDVNDVIETVTNIVQLYHK